MNTLKLRVIIIDGSILEVICKISVYIQCLACVYATEKSTLFTVIPMNIRYTCPRNTIKNVYFYNQTNIINKNTCVWLSNDIKLTP